MGKAYSNEEKKDIQNRLLEAGLAAFHDNSVKSFNIRQVVKRAGISQGGFYNFYKDKDEFVTDIIRYRALQKVKIIMTKFPESSGGLAEWLGDILYTYLIDLKHKADVREVYFELFKMMMKKDNTNESNKHYVFKDWMNEILVRWNKYNSKVEMDIDALRNVMDGALILILNSSKMDSCYFDDILKIYIKSNVSQYVKEDSKND